MMDKWVTRQRYQESNITDNYEFTYNKLLIKCLSFWNRLRRHS